MKGVNLPAELLFIEKKRFNNNRNEYRIDLWREVEKRWMVLGVLISVTMAVLSPKLGAPGGKLHTELTRFLPLAYVYYSAGQRSLTLVICRRTVTLLAVHANVVAPVVCVVTVAAFRDGVDYRVVRGALLCSVGGGCPWLSLALCRCDIAVVAVVVNIAVSTVAVPLYSLIMCGTTAPSLSTISTIVSTLLPFYLGTLNRKNHEDTKLIKLISLFLLYVDCCGRFVEAEGSLNVGDVLGTLLLECCWLCSSIAMCVLYYQCGLLSARDAHVVAVCSVPKGWEFSSTCATPGLYSLPAVFLTPTQALFLSTYQCPQEISSNIDKESDSQPE